MKGIHNVYGNKIMIKRITINLSLTKPLLDDFDRAIGKKWTRSEAIRMSMRRTILELAETDTQKTVRDLLDGKITLESLREAEQEMKSGLDPYEQAIKKARKTIEESAKNFGITKNAAGSVNYSIPIKKTDKNGESKVEK